MCRQKGLCLIMDYKSEETIKTDDAVKTNDAVKTDDSVKTNDAVKSEEVNDNQNVQEQVNEEEIILTNDQIKELIEKAQKAEDALDKFLRISAEFDNYRKRTQKEKESLYADGLAAAAECFLPLVDNMERAIEASASEENVQSLKKGFELIFQQLKDILKSLNIEEIKAVGEEFNPELHEAVMHIEDDTVDTNIVVEQFQKGYIMNGKVLRHSVVKVAN